MEKKENLMLGLRMATDPRWVNVVEKNISEILTDHAWCEQKAASNAISLLVRFPEYSDIVDEMTRISLEEMAHFKLVHNQIKKRGYQLGRERKDPYVNDLRVFIQRGGSKEMQLMDRLLLGAMIEARSCERFRILSEEISDPELRKFYRDLMASEANHYTTFLNFAKKYCDPFEVDKRWNEFLEFEAGLMTKYGSKEWMHG